MLHPRMKNPVLALPDALEALQNLGAAIHTSGVPAATLFLIEARASQINGCSVCLDMHSRELKLAGETDQRVFMVGAWREAPYFSDAERAALALTEAATRLADRSDPVPDEVWDEAARHFDESQLAGLVLAIAAINAFNRINATTRQVTGDWVGQYVDQPEPAGQRA
jgi:AhpD family alkylhydroperoxidase